MEHLVAPNVLLKKLAIFLCPFKKRRVKAPDSGFRIPDPDPDRNLEAPKEPFGGLIIELVLYVESQPNCKQNSSTKTTSTTIAKEIFHNFSNL